MQAETYAAGRELDTLIAEQVMGLQVVARDWPCGWADWDDGGGYVAAHDRELPEALGFTKQDRRRWAARYPDRGPVYTEPLDAAFYTPVPFYSTDIAAAWEVLTHFTAQGWRITSEHRVKPDPAYAWRWEFDTLGSALPGRQIFGAYGPTPALAICRAALKAVGT